MKRIAIAVVVVLIVIGAAMFVRGVQQGAAPTLSGGPQQPAWSEEAPLSAQAQRGKYLALAGDCVGCHSIRGGQAYAGGLALPTPFGTLYTPNITPDPETGIGHWTADDFWRAMHEGKSIDGSLLYPAFPYTNYTKVTREDSDAMFAFLQAVQPVREPSRPHELRFPYNQRKLLAAWRALYFNQGVYENDAAQSAQWNRGAYLVEGLGHCNACHAARNILGAVADDDYAGGLIPIQDWYAPSLSSREETGLGRWEIADIVNLLKTGVSSRSAVYGPMAAVVHFSLQHMTNEDIAADGRLPEIAAARRCGARRAPGQAERNASRSAARTGRRNLQKALRGLPSAGWQGRAARLSAAGGQPIDTDALSDQCHSHGAGRRFSAEHCGQSAAVRHAAVQPGFERSGSRSGRHLYTAIVGQQRGRGFAGRRRAGVGDCSGLSLCRSMDLLNG